MPITDPELCKFFVEVVRPHADVVTTSLENTLKLLTGVATIPTSAGNGQMVMDALQAADPTAVIADRPDLPAKQVTVAQALQFLGLAQTIQAALTANGNALLKVVNTLAVNPRSTVAPTS